MHKYCGYCGSKAANEDTEKNEEKPEPIPQILKDAELPLKLTDADRNILVRNSGINILGDHGSDVSGITKTNLRKVYPIAKYREQFNTLKQVIKQKGHKAKGITIDIILAQNNVEHVYRHFKNIKNRKLITQPSKIGGAVPVDKLKPEFAMYLAISREKIKK
jgi:hypothetical protein